MSRVILSSGDFITDKDGMLYSNASYKARTVYYDWDIWEDYSLQWYESKHGKYLSWLTEDDGYIISNGDILEADYYLTDSKGNLYQYDIESDSAIPIEGTLYSHAGRPINGFKEEFAEYMRIKR